jgi:hypothetical protein
LCCLPLVLCIRSRFKDGERLPRMGPANAPGPVLLLLLQAAHELLSGVPDDVEVWGWKEPQAIFSLPFLYRVR